LIYDFFKTKATIADKSTDSHPVRQEIHDSEEAELFTNDEITIFKGFCLVKYLHSLDPNKFMKINEFDTPKMKFKKFLLNYPH
jgi:hypothetical protein